LSKKDASPEEKPPRTLRQRLRLVLAAVMLLLIGTSPFWGPRVLSRLAFFRVRKIEVLGARYTPVNEVLARLAQDTTHSVWEPLEPLKRRVESHPQVEHAAVTRKLPGTIVVAITERRPVALVQTKNGLTAVDERGRLLPLDPSRTPIDAPVVTTTPHDTALYHLLGALQRESPRIYAQISSVVRAGSEELIFRLPAFQVRAMTNVTLARLSDIEPVEHDLARGQLHPAELDLRYRDQVIARLP
jgi:cell division protein FtsQ